MAKENNLSSLLSLNKYFARYKWNLVAGIAFVIISNFFAVYPARIIRRALDDSLKLGAGQELLKYVLIIIGFALLRGVFMFMMRQTIIVISRRVEYDLKNDLYAHYQKLNMQYYRTHNTGDLMARISEDVSRVRMYVGPAVMYGTNMITMIILVVINMLWVNPYLTLWVMLPMPLLAVLIYYVNNLIFNNSNALQEQISTLTTFAQESFSGIRVIKSFASEESVLSRFDDEVKKYRHRYLKLMKIDSLFFPLIALLMGTGTLFTMYIGGNEILAGHITPGNVAEFFIYITMLTWPVTAVGFVTSLVQRAAASQKRIDEILNIKPEIIFDEGKEISFAGKIEFNGVGFIYPEAKSASLKDIKFTINAGESLGIIGRTGCGKTTLINILSRTYDVTNGAVMVDGRNIKEINLGSMLGQTGYVLQDSFLFSDTIRNNILFGYPVLYDALDDEAKRKLDAEIIAACVAADVDKDITQFPNGYDTMLGERGITLSGGQKQRITLARAIIKQPKLLLLDDCFSAIDTSTEARILSRLGEVMKNKTSVIVSHRVSTVKNCKRILVLNHGAIEEQGTHDELLAINGYYASVFKKELRAREQT